MNPFKALIGFYSSLDLFIRISILTFLLILVSTPFIVANTQVFRPGAQVTTISSVDSGEWSSTYESISVYTNFSGDSNFDNNAILEYRKVGDLNWKKGMDLTSDRRDTVTNSGNSYTNTFRNQWRGSILGLAPNTQYEIKVTYSDPDGVQGTNPVIGTVATRKETDQITSLGRSLFVSTLGNDTSGDGSEVNPWQTVQKAADSVLAGDTVYVKSGTYSEKVVINRSGIAGSYITFRPFGTDTVTISPPGDATDKTTSGFATDGSYLRIKGFRIEGGNTGIRVSGSSKNVIVEDNLVRGFAPDGYGIRIGGNLLSPGSQDNVTVESITLSRNKIEITLRQVADGHGGIESSAYNLGGHVIRNNTIQFFYDGTGTKGSYCIGHSPSSAYSDSFKDTDIYNNICINATDDAVRLDGNSVNTRVWGNKIVNSNVAFSLNASAVGPAYVFRNVFYNPKHHWTNCTGIRQGGEGTGNAYFYHNVFMLTGSTCGNTGLGMTDSGGGTQATNIVIKNNIFKFAEKESSLSPGTKSSVAMDYNLVFDESAADYAKWNGTIYDTFDSFKTGTNQELHGIYGQALFADSVNGDFSLNSGSPGIDSGVVIAGFNDANSTWASTGSAPDIGAFETAAVLDRQVNLSSDDAYHDPDDATYPGYGGANTSRGIFSGNPGATGQATWGGFRWTSLGIPQGAIVTNAYVDLNERGYGDVFPTNLAFENSQSPLTFSQSSSPYNRWSNRTTFQTSWTWGKIKPGSWIRTPSLKAGIQELVNKYGALDSIVLLEDGTGVASPQYHEWESYDTAPTLAAKLHIEYTTGGTPPSSAPLGTTPTSTPTPILTPTPTPIAGTTPMTVNAAKVVNPFDSKIRGVQLSTWEYAANRKTGPMEHGNLAEVVKPLRPGILRFAGGLWANGTGWDRSNTQQENYSASRTWQWTDPGTGSLFPFNYWHVYNAKMMDSLGAFSKAVGADVMVQINICDNNPKMWADLVKYANVEHNYGFKYWELSNELTLNSNWQCLGKATEGEAVQEYSNRLVLYRSAMQAVDPTIKFMGPVVHQPWWLSTIWSNTDWLSPLLDTALKSGKILDVVSWHRYPMWNSLTLPYVTSRLFDVATRKDMVDNVMSEVHNVLIAHNSQAAQTAITELNTHISDNEATNSNHLGTLWMLDILPRYAYNGLNIDIWYNLEDSTYFEMLTNNGGITPSQIFARPTYYGMLMLSRYFGDQMVESSTSDTTEKLVVWATRDTSDPTKLKLIVVNMKGTADTASINLSGFTPASGLAYELTNSNPTDLTLASADPATHTERINGVKIDTTVGNVESSINSIAPKAVTGIFGNTVTYTLQPYSAVALILDSSGTPPPLVTPTSSPTSAPVSCTLNSALWSKAKAVEGEVVNLTVVGTPECNGQKISFVVKENDSLLEGGIDDPVTTNPVDVTFTGTTAVGTWTSEWQNDCGGLCLPPEFYFNASLTLDPSKTIRSSDPLMEVTRATLTPTPTPSASVPLSMNPPGGLLANQVPQFIVYGFDDNWKGLRWMPAFFGARKNPNGSPMHATFNMIGGEIGNKYPALEVRAAYDAGHEIGNHSFAHVASTTRTVAEWVTEIQAAHDAIVNATGIPSNAIVGWRSPKDAYNSALFDALKQVGYLYDSSIPQGLANLKMNDGKVYDGTNSYWGGHSLESGDKVATDWNGIKRDYTPPGNVPGVWEMYENAFILSDGTKTDRYCDQDWYHTPPALTEDQAVAMLQETLRRRINSNRAPLHLCLHGQDYEDAKGAPAGTYSRNILTRFTDWATATYPQVRIASQVELINWMKNPIALGAPTPTPLSPTQTPIPTVPPTLAVSPTVGPTPTSVPTLIATVPPTSTVIPTSAPLPCTLNSALWSKAKAVEGEVVNLTVVGTPECNGQKISFVVKENDSLLEGGIDDPVTTNPVDVTFTGTTAVGTWTSEWQNDCGGLCLPPEFYFNASLTLDPSKTIRSSDPLMEVTRAVTPVPSPRPSVAPTTHPTPVSESTVTIQGRYVDSKGDTLSINIGQKVTLNTGEVNTGLGTWDFSKIVPGSYTVTAQPIPGFATSYAVCINTNCSSSVDYVVGNFVNVDLPTNGNYADIYFKYTPIISPSPASPLIILGKPGVEATKNSATITWNTNRPSSSQVQYGVSKLYGKLTPLNDLAGVTAHLINITGLEECTVYYYQAISQDRFANIARSNTTKFTTKGCNGFVVDSVESDSLIDRLSGDALHLLDSSSHGLDIQMPPSYLDKDAYFQILRLDKDDFIKNILSPLGVNPIGNYIYHLNSFGNDIDTRIVSFSKDITVKINYTNSDITGINENSLRIQRWNGTKWNLLQNCTVDTVNKTVTCKTSSFSDFVLFGEPLSSPSPTVVSSSDSGSSGSSSGGSSGGSGGGGGGGGGGGSSSSGGGSSSGSSSSSNAQGRGADLNNDGRVNIFDLSIMLRNWGRGGTGDLNNDGRVNIFDLSILLRSFGK